MALRSLTYAIDPLHLSQEVPFQYILFLVGPRKLLQHLKVLVSNQRRETIFREKSSMKNKFQNFIFSKLNSIIDLELKYMIVYLPVIYNSLTP